MGDFEDRLYEDGDSLASIEQTIYHGGLPDCVLREGTRCWDCRFGDYRDCPVLADPDVRSYLRWRAETTAEYYKDRAKKIAALETILLRHRLPLHWEVMAKIALDEFPELYESNNVVRMLLFFNADRFEHIGDGTFRVVRRRRQRERRV